MSSTCDDALIIICQRWNTDDGAKFWPANVHLIAKGHLWFHAVIWPSLLDGLKRELPRQVMRMGSGSGRQKMSKSLGNFVDLEKIDPLRRRVRSGRPAVFPRQHGPLGVNDSDFAEAKFIEVYNARSCQRSGKLDQSPRFP